MHGVKVIHNCALILAHLPTPQAVGQATEVVEGIRVVYLHQSYDLWRF